MHSPRHGRTHAITIASPSRVPTALTVGDSGKSIPVVSYRSILSSKPRVPQANGGAGVETHLHFPSGTQERGPVDTTKRPEETAFEEDEWVKVDRRPKAKAATTPSAKSGSRGPSQLSMLSALLLPHLPDAVAESTKKAKAKRPRPAEATKEPTTPPPAPQVVPLTVHDFPSLPSKRASPTHHALHAHVATNLRAKDGKSPTKMTKASNKSRDVNRSARHLDPSNLYTSALKMLKDTLRADRNAIQELLSILTPSDVAVLRLLLLRVNHAVPKGQSKDTDPIVVLTSEIESALRGSTQTKEVKMKKKQRMKLVRLWVMAAAKKALQASQGKNIVIHQGAKPSGGDTTKTSHMHTSKKKLTRLKKVILRDKIASWVAAHPEISDVYTLTRQQRLQAAARITEAEVKARAALKQQAVAELLRQEDARRQRLIDRGKLLPNGKLPENLRQKGHAEIKFKTLASQFSKRQIRKTMKGLIAAGLVADPKHISSAVAAELKAAHLSGALSDGVMVEYTPASEVIVVEDEESAAKALATIDITSSTDVAAIKRVLTVGADTTHTATAHQHHNVIASYVDQVLSPELDEIIREMISSAYFFQERQRKTDARKAGNKKRILIGLRETLKSCKQGKAKAVVIAPNIDHSSDEDGLFEIITAIICAARAAEPPIPIIYALTRRKLGEALGKSVKASVVAFLSFENLRGMQTRALELTAALRERFATPHTPTMPIIEETTHNEAVAAVEASETAAPPTKARSLVLSASAPEWIPPGLRSNASNSST